MPLFFYQKKVCAPGKVIKEDETVGRHGEVGSTKAQVLISTVDTEPNPVEMDSENVVTKLSDVLTSVAVKVGKTLQDSEAIIDLRSGYSDRNPTFRLLL